MKARSARRRTQRSWDWKYRKTRQRGPLDRRLRGLLLVPLEDRRLLSVDITSVSSEHGDFRFVAGEETPEVRNTFEAETTGDVTSVAFSVGGMSHTDNNSLDGWSANSSMTEASTTDPLTVTASGPSGLDVETLDVDILPLPDWFHDTGSDFSTGTTFEATHDWETGYDFDVTVNHLNLGFSTPSDWVFYVPGISEPLFDMANKRTGFDVLSTFEINVPGSGVVSTTNYEFSMVGEVLGETFLDVHFAPTISDTLTIDETYGIVDVDGTIAYGGEIAPQEARLLVDETLEFDMTLFVGTADNGTYSVIVPGVAAGGHDYHFVFVDANGECHVQGFDMGPERVRVLHVDPVDGGPMVARDANITIEFSEQMNHTTMDSSTVQIVGSVSSLHDGNYQYSGTTLVVDPFTDFDRGETVSVTVTREALSFDGQRVAETYVSTFHTIDAAPTPLEVDGTHTSSARWTSGNVYIVTSDLTIPSGMSLEIEPGVVVKFDTRGSGGSFHGYYSHAIYVNGTLDVQGTAGSKVVFTSSRDDLHGGDSNGDGGATSPAAGDWGYIKFSNPANVLKHAVLRYGGQKILTGSWVSPTYNYVVWVAGSGVGNLEIRDCMIEDTYEKGVYADSGQSPWVHDNTIDGGSEGVWLNGGGVVQGNVISSMSHYGIYIGTEGTIQGNTISGTMWGVYLAGTGSSSVSGNAVTGNSYAIYQGPGDPVYSGNDFSGNTNNVIGVGGT